MISRNLLFAAGICGFGILAGILAGCVTEPEVVKETPPSTTSSVVVVEEDVWSLLAKGQGDRARPYFLGKVDVKDTDSQGRTPLHLAAEMKDPVQAAFFISLGAEIDALDNQQRTALAISAEKHDAPTAKVLTAAGANIHFRIKGNGSPARIAVRENGDFLSAFLNPASLSSVDPMGRNILHLAAEAGNAKAVDSILSVDKNVTQKDKAGKTALDIALERIESRNHAEAAEHLILAGAVSDNLLYTYFAPAVRSSNYNVRSADGMAPLHYIAREGYTGYLDFILEKNANVNIKNASGATPLHEAARSGNVRVMETLLNHGAEINTQDAQGNTVLHIAIPPTAHLAALNLFLSCGANPNLRDEHGDSPLHIAIILNRTEDIIGTLLSNRADVSVRNADGKTPLYLAVEKNRTKIIPLLLHYKSDIFAADTDGFTPYEIALAGNSPGLFALINNETVFQSDSAGNTMLHITVSAGGDPNILSYILDHQAPINARNKAGDTSLMVAVRQNKKVPGELLLSRGADIFAANANGESPLYLTFMPPETTAGASDFRITSRFSPPVKSPLELRQWMLTPQTLSARDGLGNTALHHAAQWRFDTWIPLLTELGAYTEAANATGETALFAAVKQDSPSTIRELISSGALLEARDTLGNSALHAAVRWQALRSAETLIDLGLDINCYALNGKTPLHDSIRFGIPNIELLLLERGADIEIRDAEGNTPFMEAVLSGNPTTMEQLTEMGADPNTRNFRGDTPLHISTAMERTDLATLLLGWGASIHARNAQGKTPYQYALVTSQRMVRTLLTKDRLNSSDDNGSSALHIAVQERAHISMIRSILELGVRLSSVDSEGRTALRLAIDMNLLEGAKVLADSGADVFIAARDGKTSAEVSLLKGEDTVKAIFTGRAINTKDSSGNTILHYAARQGSINMILQLMAMGASPEVKNIASESPADIAMRWNHPDAAALLY